LPRAHSARVLSPPQARNFGDMDCKSLHLGPEIHATHTLFTTMTDDVSVPTTAMTHYSHNDKSNCFASLSARSLDCMAGINIDPEVKILDRKLDCSLTPPCGAHGAINEHKLRRHHLRGVSRGSQGRHKMFAVDCWLTAAHHCDWSTASSGWPPPLQPLPLA